MINQAINRFLEAAVYRFPTVIKSRLEDRDKREMYDEYALLVFELPHSMTIEDFGEVVDDSHGTVTLYKHIRSKQTDFGQSICVFQEPGTEMFQMNATTDSRGIITTVTVKIFSSLERMMVELRGELGRMSMAPGESFYHLSDAELLSYFI